MRGSARGAVAHAVALAGVLACTAAATLPAQQRDSARTRPDSVRIDSLRADSVARADTGRVVAARPVDVDSDDPDVVVLRNGDRVTGEVTGWSRGTLAVDGDQVGPVSIDLADIARVTARGPFDVELFSGRRFRGALAPATPGAVTLVSDTTRRVIDLRAVARLRRVREGFVANLDGAITLGFTWLRSSGTSTTSLAGSARSRRTDRETEGTIDVLVTSVRGRRETARAVLLASHGRVLAARWIVGGQGRVERNRNLGFDLRATLAPALSRRLLGDVEQEFTVGGGVALLTETPVRGTPSQRAEATASARWSYDRREGTSLVVDVQSRAYAGLGVSRLRTETDARLRRALWGDFTLGLTVFLSTDTRPPAGATTRGDVGVTTTFGWSF